VHRTGWLGFFRRRQKKTKARQYFKRCGCDRVQSPALAGFENTQSFAGLLGKICRESTRIFALGNGLVGLVLANFPKPDGCAILCGGAKADQVQVSITQSGLKNKEPRKVFAAATVDVRDRTGLQGS